MNTIQQLEKAVDFLSCCNTPFVSKIVFAVSFDYDWKIISHLFFYDGMPSLTTIVFKQTDTESSAALSHISTTQQAPQSLTQDSSQTSISSNQNDRNDDMKANNANTLYTFVEMTKFTKSEFDRAITFIFYGVQFSWNVKFVQIRKKLNSSYLGYTITRSSNSFIHKHVQSDIMLKYDTCLIPVSFDSEITVSQLVQEACIVSL